MALGLAPQLTTLGYHYSYIVPKSSVADVSTLKAPYSLPAFSDPRGIPPGGTFPSPKFSYRVAPTFYGVAGWNSPLGALTGLENSQAAYDVSFIQAVMRTALTFFAGHDVVDLPASKLPVNGNVMTLPTNVFRPIYAGKNKFISGSDNLGTKATLESIYRDTTNMSRGVSLSANPPSDVMALQGHLAVPFTSVGFVDAASNAIIVDGFPDYVTYIAVDQPYFRDVVTTFASVQAIGILSGSTYYVQSVSAGDSPDSYVMRYAYVNISTDKKKPAYAWRLSESYNVGTTGTFTPTPADIVSTLNANDQQVEALATTYKHYVYDLNDPSNELSIGGVAGIGGSGNYGIPAKNAITPAFSAAKTNPKSKYYDSKFSAKVLGFNVGYGSSGDLTENISAIIGTNNLITGQVLYTSPTLLVSLPGNTRVGYEYATTTLGTGYLATSSGTIILLNSNSGGGMAAVHDDGTCESDVFLTPSQGVQERRFYDNVWEGGQKIPASQTSALLMGEFPFRSGGEEMLIPTESNLNVTPGNKGAITLPTGTVATSMHVKIGSHDASNPSSIILSDAGNIKIEAVGSLAATLDATVPLKVGLPASAIDTVILANSGQMVDLWGINISDSLLSAPMGASTLSPTTDVTDYQVSSIGSQAYPLPAVNVSASIDGHSSFTAMAFDNSGRIDMAVRVSQGHPFALVRDVVLRIPNDFDKGGTVNGSPSASNACLLHDGVENIILFYLYKQVLAVKAIPQRLLTGPRSPDERHLTFEAAIIKQMLQIKPFVVFGVQPSDLDTDVRMKAIQPLPVPMTGTMTISQYHAATDGSMFYAFIQSSTAWYIVRSSECAGDISMWDNLIPNGFSPMPVASSTLAASGTIGDTTALASLSLSFYDNASTRMLLFYFYDGALLVSRIPVEVLRGQDLATMTNALANVTPLCLYGPLGSDLAARGIKGATSVQDNSNTLALSPHRIACIQTPRGYLRLWFYDGNQKLRSLVSLNNGDDWLTEQQHGA